MKKKLLLILSMVALFVMVFAFSVSATGNSYFGDVEIIDLDKDGVSDINIYDMVNSVVDGSDGRISSASAMAKISCSCSKGSHTFPAYYITSPKSTGDRFYCFNLGELNKLLPSYCGAKTAVDEANIVSYEIPNGYTAIYSGFFYKGGSGSSYMATGIKYFSFAKCSTLKSLEATSSAKNWFTNSTIEAVDLGPYITNIPVMLFYNCDYLTSIAIPDQITSISKQAFEGCAELQRVYFTENSLLATVDNSVFKDCVKLEAFYIPPKLTSLGGSGSNQAIFQGCKKLYFLNNPNETEKPTVYYFPSTVTSYDGEIFKSCTNLNNTIVFPSEVKSLPNGWAFNGTNAINVVFLGDMEKVSTTGNAWTSGIKIYFCNEADKSTSDLTGINTSASKIFCHGDNASHLYLVETVTQATCTEEGFIGTSCFCGAKNPNGGTKIDPKGHSAESILIGISYDNFFAQGNCTYDCPDCNESFVKEKCVSALFVSLGYSKTEYPDSGAILNGFAVNQSALAKYNEYSDNDISAFGIVAAAEKNVTNGDLLAGKNVNVDFTERGYDIFEMKVTGLTDETKSTLIYITAYVTVGGKNYYAENGEFVESAESPISFETIQ